MHTGAMERTCLIGKDRAELEAFALSLGLEAYRGRQLFHWIYRKRATSFEEMTNLKKSLREQLAEKAELHLLRLDQVQESRAEPTRKFLFRLPDGLAVETVYMEDADRRTICISSQVGCALGCDFCATGRMGFVRNLTAGEMVDQILWVERFLATEITNVVVMGMGEPFLNYDEVLKAAEIIADPEGIAIGKRRITISTSGIVPAIYRFVNEKRRFKLAVSLNATTDEVRSQLMPINRKYPLEKLLEAVRYYAAHNHNRITFEYILIRGVNDTPEDARRLKKLLRGIPCKINLIPYNPIDGRYHAPDEEDLQRFIRPLLSMPAAITIRRSKGQDISAACGQLYTEVGKGKAKAAILV